MEINRQSAKAYFAEYVAPYDISDEKIKLKVIHTYKVCDLCESIAKSIGLSENDIDIAWLTGLLHDVGRFEQVRRYGTFSDALSIDHAQFGADLLFKDGLIRKFVADDSEDTLLETAIRQHSGFRVDDKLDARTLTFCHILRDADKVDIMRVNVESPLEDIYNVTTDELMNSAITPEVLQSFYEEHAVLRALKRTPIDNLVGHISLTYELVYPLSLQLAKEQGFLDKMLGFKSANPQTLAEFAKMTDYMHSFIKRKTTV